MKDLLTLLFVFFSVAVTAQEITLRGVVRDAEAEAGVEGISVVFEKKTVAITNAMGEFSFKAPVQPSYTISFSLLGYETRTVKLRREDAEKPLSLDLNRSIKTFSEVVIEDKESRRSTLKRIDPKLVTVLPGPINTVEALIKTLPGVSSNNELSSQYSVRGGNYDENLIYVNDIEIYRPFLVRSGQQEGLSFINSDMVSSILFSAGGFDAKYGDKMASVLDVQYRNPKNFGGSVTGSLLDGAVQLEGASKDKRFTWIGGSRIRSNQYVLTTLDTKGDYKPRFTDGQVLFNYDFTPEFTVQVLGNFAQNLYRMVPSNRETDFGTVKSAYRLKIYFDGQEVDDFTTGMGAVSAIYKPRRDLTLKLIGSAFKSNERETFDIQGEYFIGQLETDFSKDNFGSLVSINNVGTYLYHARNQLNATVYNGAHVGYYKNATWGIKLQHEEIFDKLSEWKLIDSVGYAIPQGDPTTVDLQDVVKQNINLSSNRLTNYVQNSWNWGDSTEISLTAGVRSHYWDVNEQLLVSPRATVSVLPNWKKDVLFRFSSGYYYQPPFYRELRDFEGNINTNLKAQTSIHFVLGADYNFSAWKRPFKLTGEVYYKYLDNLVPYEIDNVRIRYYAQNLAKGYAQGVDMKINGEFIKGIESWASLSVMETKEDIKNDFYYVYYNDKGEKIVPGFTTNSQAVDSTRVNPGYIPRPTDQRFNFSIFFQDYIPKFPTYRMSLTLMVGSGLPFGPPSYERYKDTLRIPPYRRVDIGFTKVLKTEDKVLPPKNPFRFVKTAWLSLEVFNLLGINNTISYLWVKDISNRQYAIPNYLTNRRLNLKLVVKF